MHIYKLTGIATPEVVLEAILDKYQPCHLDATVERVFRSPKQPLAAPENEFESKQSGMDVNQYEEDKIKASKGIVLDTALLQRGIVCEHRTHASIVESCPTTTPHCITLKWSGYPGNNPSKLSTQGLMKW